MQAHFPAVLIIPDMEHRLFVNHGNSGSLRCVVCLSEPLLSVGPDSPSARATNLRRSSVTKLVLKLMRRVNILRQAVCIRPLTGFMLSCNLCLASLGNSLGPGSWVMVIYGGRCEAWHMYLYSCLSGMGAGIKTRCGATFWRQIKYDTGLNFVWPFWKPQQWYWKNSTEDGIYSAAMSTFKD